MEGGGRQRAMAACSRDRNPSALIAYVWVECSAGEGYGGMLEIRGASAVAVVWADGGRLPAPDLTSPERRRSSVSLLPL